MKNEKQVKLGSLVKMSYRCTTRAGLYGIVFDKSKYNSYHIHLQDGTKYWSYPGDFEVLV